MGVETVNLFLELLSKGGIIALLLIITVALVYWITNRTVPKELYEEHRRDIDDLKTEFRQLVGPTFDMMAKILERQDRINNELIRQLDNQTKYLSGLSENIREMTNEIRGQQHRTYNLPPGDVPSEK